LALESLSADSVPNGLPLSLLEARLLPIYLHHRYQLVAAAKAIGGARFSYAIKTPSGISPAQPFAIAPPGEQRAALDAVPALSTRHSSVYPQNCWPCCHRVRTAMTTGLRRSLLVAPPRRSICSAPQRRLRI
jgi:hypothetical protein